ncbi:MAG: sigma-70 family RNA polymerase sigma factor [Gemmatimonadales bacterium]|nr:sigma-70 family RNA polymerase sigma factor [Gemmatimonadales bacterium]
MTDPGDGELLQRSAAGDAEAFEAFAGRHVPALMRYLGLLGAEPADADDATQETLLAAWRSAGTFRGGDSARGWLLTIGRHALARLHRRRAAEPTAFAGLEAADELGLAAGWGDAASPLDALERAEARAAVRQALARLPEAERETVYLRDVEELPGGAVAALTGVTLAAMKSRLHRGRLRLAADLGRLLHASA